MAEEDEGSAAHTLHRQASLAASQGLITQEEKSHIQAQLEQAAADASDDGTRSAGADGRDASAPPAASGSPWLTTFASVRWEGASGAGSMGVAKTAARARSQMQKWWTGSAF